MTDGDTGEFAVVAGVDGSASALRAVRWAAHEAVRRGAPLRLVHVCYLVPVRHSGRSRRRRSTGTGSSNRAGTG